MATEGRLWPRKHEFESLWATFGRIPFVLMMIWTFAAGGEQGVAAVLAVFLLSIQGLFLVGIWSRIEIANRPKPLCPSCGGRLDGQGEICQHCHTPLRWVVNVPMLAEPRVIQTLEPFREPPVRPLR